MSLLFILAVGQDPAVLSTRASILRAAGYVVKEASSVGESIDLCREMDFDLVLLCHSLSVEDRNGLTRAVRSSGLHMPICVISPMSDGFTAGITDGILSSNPAILKKELEETLRPASAQRVAVQGETAVDTRGEYCGQRRSG